MSGKSTKRREPAASGPTTKENLEPRFDAGESVLDYFDKDKAIVREGGAIQRVNVDFPSWAVSELDREADRRGIARQALIKGWIVDRLDEIDRRRRSG